MKPRPASERRVTLRGRMVTLLDSSALEVVLLFLLAFALMLLAARYGSGG